MNQRASKLLVVDDDSDFRVLMRELISHAFHVQILEASNGTQAMEILKSHSVAVIVSDLNMPNGNGMELLSHWEADFRDQVSFVLFTGADIGSIAHDKVSIIRKPNFTRLISVIRDLEIFGVK